jgi:hypothetical protein
MGNVNAFPYLISRYPILRLRELNGSPRSDVLHGISSVQERKHYP